MSEITIAIKGLVALRESINQASVDITKLVNDIETETTQHIPVPPVEKSANGELVVPEKCLYVVDGDVKKESGGDAVWHYGKNIPKEYRLRMDDGYFSKLAIGSQFATTCADDIYPSGMGEFLVVDTARPAKAGKFYLEDWGVVNKATCDWSNGTTAIIVIPCDLAYYTKTDNGIAYVMYETMSQNRYTVLSSNHQQWNYSEICDGFTSDFIRSLHLIPVPLSVSAITGIVVPEEGV